MSFTVLLPSVHAPWTRACLRTMAPPVFDRTHVYDNTQHNAGVAAAWNFGVRLMRARKDDWLVIVSAAIRFGPPGGCDFVEEVEGAAGAWAVEAGLQPRRPDRGFGWHLIAFPASTFETVGSFDENFWPAYYEDNDFGYRIALAAPGIEAGGSGLWPKVPVDADLAGTAHGLRLAGVKLDIGEMAGYYRRKWGGPPAHEEFRTPFGHDRPLSWWPTPEPARYRDPSR